MRRPFVWFACAACATAFLGGDYASAKNPKGKDPKDKDSAFRRVATFPVYENQDVDTETVSEIMAASEDGRTVIYTDAEQGSIGFVDISNPADPVADGVLDVGGDPTSVGVVGRYAVVAVNTSESFVDPSGKLVVVNLLTRTIERVIDVPGQPDSIAVSADRRFITVAIENERDEDVNDGELPQLPGGSLVIVDVFGPSFLWQVRNVALTGIADYAPEDPEPEYVAINDRNVCAVTLQENNHVVLVDLEHLRLLRILFPFLFYNGALITGDFSAGAADLFDIDALEDDVINPIDALPAVLREPDAIAWVDNRTLATADEGDLFGGSRGFTFFETDGDVVFEAGADFERLAMRIGHYPESRSENKGTEPEGIAFAKYGKDGFLFVGSERGSFVAVYRVEKGKPRFVQALPAGLGPEGLLAIPKRGLFLSSSENDDRGDGYRAVISVYQLTKGDPTYPTIQSADRASGTPIPWGALSALAADPDDADRMYTVYDSYYDQSRIFEIDLTQDVPTIVDEIVLTDDGATVNYDPEGLAVRPAGGFWVATEGSGDVPNRLLRASASGAIEQEVLLPAALDAVKTGSGFEGVAVVEESGSEIVYVCVQREWGDDAPGFVKIGRYDVGADAWTFASYPLDAPTSPNGGWVGLSEITALGGGEFAVIERDNQAGDDARIKKVYRFSVDGVAFASYGADLPLLSKTFVRDLIGDLEAPNGAIIEKVEGLALLPDGDVWIVTDNDGVDDSNGETQLLNLGPIFGE